MDVDMVGFVAVYDPFSAALDTVYAWVSFQCVDVHVVALSAPKVLICSEKLTVAKEIGALSAIVMISFMLVEFETSHVDILCVDISEACDPALVIALGVIDVRVVFREKTADSATCDVISYRRLEAVVASILCWHSSAVQLTKNDADIPHWHWHSEFSDMLETFAASAFIQMIPNINVLAIEPHFKCTKSILCAVFQDIHIQASQTLCLFKCSCMKYSLKLDKLDRWLETRTGRPVYAHDPHFACLVNFINQKQQFVWFANFILEWKVVHCTFVALSRGGVVIFAAHESQRWRQWSRPIRTAARPLECRRNSR
jgi:hypothetical protein